MKKIRLNKQSSIPIIGFGTWEMVGAECTEGVRKALEIGYRHIDTADAYSNHTQVAQGISESGIAREEIFLTSKIFLNSLQKSVVLEKCEQFLEELHTNYIDLLLIHWPNQKFPLHETLESMRELKSLGKIRAIGVSNFTSKHIEDALATGTEITNNQVELHPTFNQNALKSFCDSKKIVITAYSPLGRGDDLQNSVVLELAKKYEATPSQIILSWIMSQDIVVIPKSSSEKRIQENFNALNLKLEKVDIEKMNKIKQKERILNPHFADFDY